MNVSDSTRWRQQIKVELKERHDSDISRQSRILNSSFYGSHAQLLSAELKSRCAWIGSACCYHKCVGFINSFGHLTIWDFGEVYTFNSSTLGYAGAVQSLCVTPCVPISASSQQFVLWGDNMVVPFNKWVDILAAKVDAGQYNLDGGLGQNPSNNPSGGNSLLEREQRTIVADVFRTSAHPGRIENNLNISDLKYRKRELRGERLLLNNFPEVVVYISGCHMSSNPGPGVGVGRALRAEFTSSQLHLVGVDSIVGDNFQALTDHVFDEVRAIELVTSCAKKLGYTTSKGIDNECWELLRDWLAPGLEPKCDKEHGPSRFYLLPCSDQDILSLARKVYSVLESKNCSQRDSIVCSRILCPPLSVVLDCRKPQIVCLRNMNCFKIPDFFTLTQDVCLMEVQTFCEVEYPVLFKVSPNFNNLERYSCINTYIALLLYRGMIMVQNCATLGTRSLRPLPIYTFLCNISLSECMIPLMLTITAIEHRKRFLIVMCQKLRSYNASSKERTKLYFSVHCEAC
jgi:hypothetical protein